MGKMTQNSIDIVINAAKQVQSKNPELFDPLAKFFNIDIDERLENPEYRKNLYYS